VAGIGASATTSGAQTGLVGASHRLPHALVVVASPVALFALLILPVAMAVQLLVRRQFRRLGEAVATGVLAAGVTAVVNEALTRPAASRLYYAIIMTRPGTSHAAALDPYLAGLVAYATMVGLAGRPYWRNALWAAIAVYAIVHVGALHTSVLTLITVIAGRAIGLAVRYVAGSASQRPRALDIAGARLSSGPHLAGGPVIARHTIGPTACPSTAALGMSVRWCRDGRGYCAAGRMHRRAGWQLTCCGLRLGY
jgi:glycosyltransferase 2 family protein